MAISRNLILAIACSLVFFIASLISLPDYNVSWDETIHFRRGQAYLHYFLTGQKNYQNLNIPRRSLYQSNLHNAEWFLKKDIGHPPLNDELAALTNYIFFQQLGILTDIVAHHLFNIIASTLLVFLTVYFAACTIGIMGSIITYLSLVTYPLFWSESHFNIKDPAETAFMTGVIISFVLYMTRKKNGYLILSFIFAGFALGTKLNVIFLPFVIVPYLIIQNFKKFKIPSIKTTLAFITGFIITFLIFLFSWPYLWQKFPSHLFDILNFYKEIGTGTNYQPQSFFFAGWNTYPILWIIFTTPPVVLFLSLLGVIFAFRPNTTKYNVQYLLLFWLFIPIIRVSAPGTSIYGGVRQIMEYIPALALLTGLGANVIMQKFHSKKILIVLLLLFIYPLYILFKLHPYENVYFNSLLGGLPGAKAANFPSWGNSFGSAYGGVAVWLNQNAERSATISLLQGTPSNIPPTLLRPDLNFLINNNLDATETHFSGIERKGEYLVELTNDDTGRDFYYAWEYVANFLNPVFELKVDGVTILTIWKNDLEHTKEKYKLKETQYANPIKIEKMQNIRQITLSDTVLLSRLKMRFNDSANCIQNKSIEVATSLDAVTWRRELDGIPQFQLYRKPNLEGNIIEYFFAGRSAKYIRLTGPQENLCILNIASSDLIILR